MSLDWTHGELQKGLRCFHSGAFFEAHEHWESVWLAAQEPERTFLQGLIQVAASFHHFQRGNCAGTISLLRSALRRLTDIRRPSPVSLSRRFARRSAYGSKPSKRSRSLPHRLSPSSNSQKEDHFPERV